MDEVQFEVQPSIAFPVSLCNMYHESESEDNDLLTKKYYHIFLTLIFLAIRGTHNGIGDIRLAHFQKYLYAVCKRHLRRFSSFSYQVIHVPTFLAPTMS